MCEYVYYNDIRACFSVLNFCAKYVRIKWMAKEETFEVKGVVQEAKPNGQFIILVTLNNQETKVLATLSGSIRRFRIKITPGDTVTVCMTPYDLRRGRITYRVKEDKNAGIPKPGC